MVRKVVVEISASRKRRVLCDLLKSIHFLPRHNWHFSLGSRGHSGSSYCFCVNSEQPNAGFTGARGRPQDQPGPSICALPCNLCWARTGNDMSRQVELDKARKAALLFADFLGGKTYSVMITTPCREWIVALVEQFHRLDKKESRQRKKDQLKYKRK